jgi:hypothetical protein
VAAVGAVTDALALLAVDFATVGGALTLVWLAVKYRKWLRRVF